MEKPLDPNAAKTKLLWYQHAWLALPFALVFIGGAIGGACGGAAWAINQTVFRKNKSPVLRYVWTALIASLAVVAYVLLSAIFLAFVKTPN